METRFEEVLREFGEKYRELVAKENDTRFAYSQAKNYIGLPPGPIKRENLEEQEEYDKKLEIALENEKEAKKDYMSKILDALTEFVNFPEKIEKIKEYNKNSERIRKLNDKFWRNLEIERISFQFKQREIYDEKLLKK